MHNKTRKIQKDKLLFGGIVVISFLAFYVYNVFTPYMSDDLMFDRSLYQSVADVFRQEYLQYINWNGRSVLQIILKFSMLMPKTVFDVLNSLCYVVTMLLIYWNVKGKKSYDCFLYILINLLVWNFAVDFSQTMLWVAGACNYLWGVMIILSFITAYRYFLEKSEIKNMIPVLAGLFLLGILAGWGNENTSGGAILIVLLLTAIYFYDKRKIERWMVAGIGGMGVGFLFLLLAPGNKARGEMMKASETYSGLAALISRGLKVLKAIDKYLLIYIAVIVLLGTYFYYKKYKLEEFKEVIVFAFASLATAGVLIFTPEPMPRAYFGANIYMMIAALQMIQMIRQEDTLLISLKTGGIIAATIAMLFVYVEEGANLVRIRREINIREEYIIKEIANDNYDLILPALRPEFESKYSMAHLCDISDNEESWNNEIYKNAYSFWGLTVLPWDEWEETVGVEAE